MSKHNNWDLFISHASEDKARFVAPLAKELTKLGASVWYDEFSLQPGDSLSESVDKGIARSRCGVVVISPNFFKKKWPRHELRGLVTRSLASRDSVRIIPIWHKVGHEEVAKQSPSLADAFSLVTSKLTISAIALKLLAVVRPDLAYHANRVELSNKIIADAREGGAKFQVVDPKVLRPSPLPPAQLPAKLVARIVLIDYIFGEAFGLSLNDALKNFSLDLNPETEIEIWECMAATFVQLCREWRLNRANRKELGRILLELSFGKKVRQIQSSHFDRAKVKEIGERYQNVLPRHFA